MKRILKKIITVIVCGSLLLSLAACGGNNDNTSQESKTSDEILVEITNNNGEIENITGQELRDLSEENTVMFDNLYKGAFVKVMVQLREYKGILTTSGILWKDMLY